MSNSCGDLLSPNYEFLAESDDIKICHTASKSLEFRVS